MPLVVIECSAFIMHFKETMAISEIPTPKFLKSVLLWIIHNSMVYTRTKRANSLIDVRVLTMNSK